MHDGMEGAKRVWHFSRQLRACGPQVFHAHLSWPLACKFGLVGAVLARVPATVATAHLYFDFPVDPSILIQQRIVCAVVGGYTAVSENVARQMSRKLRWPARKFRVIRNSIPQAALEHTPQDCSSRPTSENKRRPVVLTVARLDEQKGHCYLLEAAAQLPEVDFALAGDGTLRASLEAQARSLGLAQRVQFLGHRTDIPDLLASCDVFVLPSLYEGLPLSILEAMAACKPVIATQIGGTDEAVIAGETGLLVPPANPAALAEAIRTILAHPELARRLATSGRRRVQQEFSENRMIRQFTELYDELLTRRRMRHDHR
jgi:glycosyltransferase involved in cell wall biosynthesis